VDSHVDPIGMSVAIDGGMAGGMGDIGGMGDMGGIGMGGMIDAIVVKSMDALKDHDIMKFVIIVMFIEHVIVLVKVYLEEYIEDVPKFVKKKSEIA